MLFVRHASKRHSAASQHVATPPRQPLASGSTHDGALRQSVFASLACKHGVLTICPTGPKIAEREATIIADQVTAAFQSLPPLRAAVIDLSSVQMMSSFGLGLCISIANHARQSSARAILVGMSPHMADLFRMMKVDRLFVIVGSPNELASALAA